MASRAVTFDSNVLFYAFDARDAVKQTRCAAILAATIEQQAGFVMLQSLGEFTHAAARKGLLSRKEAARVARDWALALEARTATSEAFDLALDWWADQRLSYWDALLVATAAKNGAGACVSEDLSDGAVIGGVEIVNPFAVNADERLGFYGLNVAVS